MIYEREGKRENKGRREKEKTELLEIENISNFKTETALINVRVIKVEIACNYNQI